MGYAVDKISKKVTITSKEEHPLKITDISSTIDDKIKYELKTIEEGKASSLEIKTLSGLKESFRGKIVLKTNSQKKPEIEPLVIGVLKKEVKLAPQYLYFGIIDTGKKAIDLQSIKRKVMVCRYREGSLTNREN